MTTAERPLLSRFGESVFHLLRRKPKEAEFISVSDQTKEKLKELMVCDSFPKCKHPGNHRKKWNKTSSLEWDNGDPQRLYFLDHPDEQQPWATRISKWHYRPEENLIALEFVAFQTPPFKSGLEKFILERAPNQLFQTLTREGPVEPKMKILLDIPFEDPGEKYWEPVFKIKNQEEFLSDLLREFS